MEEVVAAGWRVRAAVAVAVIPPLLELVSLTRLQRILLRASSTIMPDAPDDRVAARWVDDALLGLRGPWARTCLRRAAVLFYLLRKAGRTVDLCIGVRRDAHGEILAHAWLVLGDELYLEPDATANLVSDYHLIARFPRT